MRRRMRSSIHLCNQGTDLLAVGCLDIRAATVSAIIFTATVAEKSRMKKSRV